MAARRGHLIGVFGLFWDAEFVPFWEFGRTSVPLLGQRGANSRTRVIVDFRKAVGSYVLYNDYGPTYTGIATSPGLGARLHDHRINPPRDTPWTRFSWFAFGDVHDLSGHTGWGEVNPRDRPVATDADTNVRELEALIIQLLGTHQAQMKFQVAKEWGQLPWWDAEGLCRGDKVDPRGFPKRWVKRWNEKPPAI